MVKSLRGEFVYLKKDECNPNILYLYYKHNTKLQDITFGEVVETFKDAYEKSRVFYDDDGIYFVDILRIEETNEIRYKVKKSQKF